MIQLLQSLQRKLIERTREEDSKIKSLAEQEEIYLHCKTLLANQVGPEALEQVKDFEKMLSDKKMQLRHSRSPQLMNASGNRAKYVPGTKQGIQAYCFHSRH